MTADAPRPFPELPEDIESIHIIGICGTAMGSLAAMLEQRGFTVRGSDAMAYPPMSTWLEERGIDIMKGYDASNLDWDPDLVIVGNVCRAEYADAVEMRKRGLPHLSLPEALQHFFFRDKKTLVITGTHGKTTTSSMLAWILATADRDPSFMIGGITGNFGSNFRLGDGDQFVVEGDEYDTAYFDKVPKFWHYRPHRATINNIEFDHADIYPDVDEIEMVFRKFVDMIPADGSLWVNGDDPRALEVSAHCAGERKTFGLGAANDLYAQKISYGDMTACEVIHDGRSLGEFELPCMGEFNLRNMLGATGIALDEGVDVEDIKEAMRTFKSVKKRQELVGEVDDILVFDDFAHHPTAVNATVEALRARFPERRLWTIFEAKSNTSRRRVFQDDYPTAFEAADVVILSKPFQKKDSLSPDERLDINQLAEQIRELGPETILIPDVDDIVGYVGEHAKSGDVIAGLSGSAFGGLHQKIVDRLKSS
ncbi:MAG: UDP-N-acetylmuramate:L-alanyl-gamma-D-glutamyl-meso-diaminopimelate ligase [Myxococcota bacterium]